MQIIETRSATDIACCTDIWLQASIAAHAFIAPEFWQSNYTAMCEQYLPASKVYIARGQGKITGFAALHRGMLAALFVMPAYWGKNTGSRLLCHVQGLCEELRLTVYTQNSRAVAFYRRHGFTVLQEQICPHTGELELLMWWRKHSDYHA